MGRPTDYKLSFCKKAQKLCEGGATDVEVADCLDISSTTLYRWKAEHPEFREALKAGKAVADDRVERSLYNRAVGYTFDSTKIFMPAGANEPVYAPFREHVPPDVTAAIFWLKNRQPEQWRDKSQQEHVGPGGGPIIQRIERVIVDPANPANTDSAGVRTSTVPQKI